MRRERFIAGSVATAAATLAEQVLPGSALAASSPPTPAQIGLETYQGYQSKGLIVTSSPYATTVRRIVHKVRTAAEVDGKVYIVKGNQLNLCASPGFVFINDGALRSVQNEAELANALGHEMSHLKLGHVEKIARAELGVGIVAKITNFFARHSSQNAQTALTTGTYVAKLLILNNFTRQQEYDADQKGAELAAAAGYNPWGSVWFLRVAKQLQGDVAFETYGKQHPPIDDRIKRLEHRLSTDSKFAHWPSHKPHGHGLKASS